MSLVLIVDDEEAIVETLCDIVGCLGHEPLRAYDGEAALALARARKPDLIVTDYMMPRLNGSQLVEKLQGDPALSQLPVILMSAAAPRGVPGIHAFLAKPIPLETFEKAVLGALAASPSAPVAGDDVDDGKRAAGGAEAELGIAREEMLNWVAHEIKTPLSSARMMAEVLIRRAGADADTAQAHRLELIVRQLDRMTELVTSVLDAARLGSRGLRLHRERRDLCAFLEEVIASWRDRVADCELRGLLPPGPAELDVDPEQLRRVLDNLISNALKHGGRAAPVEVALTLSALEAEITVTDQGPGIDASELSQIFDRFHTVKGQPGRGHGLGLYIAATLARMHGGSLTAESVKGKGATFRLRLPREDGRRQEM